MRSVICAITSPTQTTMPRPPRPLVRSARWSGRFAASKRTCLQGSKINSSPQGEPPWRPHRREEVDEGPNLL